MDENVRTSGENPSKNTARALRRELRRRGRAAIKRNYWIYLFGFLLAVFLGAYNTEAMILLSETKDPFGNQAGVTEQGTVVSVATFTDFLGTSGKENVKLVQQLYHRAVHGKTDKIDRIKQEVSQSASGLWTLDSILGNGRIALGSIIVNLSSGSFYVGLAIRVGRLFRGAISAAILFPLLAVLLSYVCWTLITNTLLAINARIFLEGCNYDVIPVKRFLFFHRVHCWRKVAWSCLVRHTYQTLWELTIIGGVIKHYSYIMVPFILAENPSLKANEAITLSRRMMDGHKWECFKLEISFLGWSILGMTPITALTEVFYSKPYYFATMAEYYCHLRSLAKENKLPGVEVLCDEYLYRKPDEALVRASYPAESVLLDAPTVTVEPLTGKEGFLAENFGMVLHNGESEKKHARQQALLGNQREIRDMVNGREYAGALHPLHERNQIQLRSYRYLQNYPVWNIVLFFFLASFIGWVWEVSIHLVEDRAFINRGVMHGPWLPIYGVGSVMVLVLLKRFRRYPVGHFAVTVLVCGIVEYMTSWYLEKTRGGVKWWDYSGYYLNINGRVCVEGLLVFGIAGTVTVYLLMPLINDLLNKITPRVLIPLALVLLVLFGVDSVYSKQHPNTGVGITDYENEESASVDLDNKNILQMGE